MKALGEAEFTIVGTGLMGSSLALSLRGKVKTVHGVDADPVQAQSAVSCFDDVTTDLERVVAQADVLVLAAPIRAILELLARLPPMLKPGALVVDLGSTKQDIVRAMDDLPANVLAVGGHPMCGKEQSGPAAADGALFKGCVFVVCPTQRSTPDALTFVQTMLGAIGAKTLVLTPERHDAAVAAISHLPYLLSVGLVATASRAAQDDSIPWKLASSGFRDTSRLAASDVTMMGDILLTNREAILDALKLFGAQLASLEEALQSSDEGRLRGILDSARQTRLDWARFQNRAEE
jgi:prephenate dehydrogenase